MPGNDGESSEAGMRSKAVLLFAVSLPLTGCADPASGASTRAEVSQTIDITCVDAALRATSGVGTVSKVIVNQLSAGSKTYGWEYGGDLRAALEITLTGNTALYLNTNVLMGRDKTRGKAFEPLMRRVNSNLEASCHIPISDSASIEVT